MDGPAVATAGKSRREGGVALLEDSGAQGELATAAEVVEPSTGLVFVELSHEWGHYTPAYPGYRDIEVRRVATHAMHGVLTQHVVTVMHNGTHVNAPLHLAQGGLGVGEVPLDRFFGNGVVLSIPKGEWEYVEPSDLAAAGPEVQPGDVVIVNTGWHRNYADDMEYFGHAPGLSEPAAQWLAERQPRFVGIDTANIDHPLATTLAQAHRFVGPTIVELPRRYRQRTGHEVVEDFPDWNPAHRLLAKAGIPTVENVGGDVDAVTGRRCTFHAVPWHWPQADACLVRLVAIHDPSGKYRIESGEG
ncbi:MAG: cyclase family protein [Acidimicrobiales bacterium]